MPGPVWELRDKAKSKVPPSMLLLRKLLPCNPHPNTMIYFQVSGKPPIGRVSFRAYLAAGSLAFANGTMSAN